MKFSQQISQTELEPGGVIPGLGLGRGGQEKESMFILNHPLAWYPSQIRGQVWTPSESLINKPLQFGFGTQGQWDLSQRIVKAYLEVSMRSLTSE